MAIQQRVFYVIFIILLFGVSLSAGKENFSLESMSLEAIDSLSFEGVGLSTYSYYINSAVKGIEDTANEEHSFKGEVLMAVLASSISNDIDAERIDPNDMEMKELLSVLSDHNYHIYQPKVSRVIKVAYYACHGRYDHLYKRFSSSLFVWPLGFLGLIIVVFIALQLGNVISIVSNRKMIFTLFAGLLLATLLTVVFKATCEECVSEYSLYGIPF